MHIQPDSLLLVSALIAVSNLALVAVLVVVALGGRRARSSARHAARKLLLAQRRSRALQYALNITLNQFHALRRKVGSKRLRTALPTPPLVKLDGGRARFVAPPPLPALQLDGEDPSSWGDSGIRTMLRPDPALTETQPIAISETLLEQSRPPRS